MNPLAKLVNARRIELGLTWDEVADRGGFSSHTIVYALARKTHLKQTPRMETLRGIAVALDLQLSVVCEAAGISAGCGPRIELLPLHTAAAQLTAGQRAELLDHALLLLRDTPDRTPV